MTDIRKYDIVVFGASGVTGKYVIEELALQHGDLNWCIAGRNREKLQAALKEVGDIINKSLTHIDVLEAEVGNDDSLATMCKSATILLNCVGPYRFSGEKVVEQCVKQKTHCVDVSGEPQFLESVQLKYFEEAKKQGVYIVGSCGFDSIPCDLGFEVVRKKFDGDLSYIETYLSMEHGPGNTINFGTWQSAIHGLAHAAELKPLRKALKENLFNKPLPKPEYRIKSRGNLFHSNVVGGWCIPFIGSDKSVITRTQMYNFQFKNERPVQVQTYMKPPSLLTTIATLLVAAVFMVMTKFDLGCYLLERFPELFSFGFFSRTPPSRQKATGSFKAVFNAKGWTDRLADPSDRHTEPPNKSVKAVLTGPDPGYITTAICLVNSAVIILTEKDKLPVGGGVFTPAVAFTDTTLMSKLEGRGISITLQQG